MNTYAIKKNLAEQLPNRCSARFSKKNMQIDEK
ncbi:hypothetical protein S101395_00994 [Bacillus sonorensis]|uniref:Uncharacterized protein n=1 Tax=Bacillus sonorensis TaxID=119858 RepID=A0ABM6LEH1_9BACI|nr:hypothetical protein S101395_00994 [Bacillus sonorensis]